MAGSNWQNQDIEQLANLLVDAIENGSSSGTKTQTDFKTISSNSVNFEDKTKVVINVIEGTALITVYDTEDNLMYSFSRTPNDAILEFSNYGRPINKINVTCDLLTDICEVISSNI